MPIKLVPLNLKSKITGLVLLLFLSSLWLLTFNIAERLERDMTELLAAQQFSTAAYIAGDVESNIQNHLEILQRSAASITPAMLAKPAVAREHLSKLVGLTALFKTGIILIARDGKGVADYPPLPSRADGVFTEQEYFREVLATGRAAVGKPRVGRFTMEPGIGMGAPIKDEFGKIIGVLAGFSTLSDSTLFGQVERATVGKSGWVAIDAPKHGIIVTASDPSRILTPLAKPGVNAMLDRFIGGFEGSGIAVNSRGIETLTSAKGIPSAGWLAQVVLPTEEAFAPVRRMKAVAYSMASGLSVLVGLLAWMLIRRSLRPLDEAAAAIEDMSEGRARLHELPIRRHDEIGKLLASFNLLLEQRQKVEDALRRNEEIFQAIQLSITESIVLLDPVGCVIAANPTAAERLDMTQSELMGKNVFLLMPPETALARRALIDEAFRTGKPCNHEDARDGMELSSTYYPVTDRQGKVQAMVVVAIDVTEQKRSLRLLERERLLAKATLDALTEHVCVVDLEGQILAVNQGWQNFALANGGETLQFGVGINYLLACDTAALTSDEARRFALGLRQVLRGELDKFSMEYRCDSAIEKRWFSVNVLQAHCREGARAVIAHSDISERKNTEETRDLMAKVFTNSGEAILITDAQVRIVKVNAAFTRLTGYSEEEALGRNPKFLSAGMTPRDVYQEMWSALDEKGMWEGEFWDRRKTGEPYPKWTTVSVIRDQSGQIVNYIGSFVDITERKASEEKVRYLAHYDALTGLPNRFSLHGRLEQAMAYARRGGRELAAMLIDLDRFKGINDTLGHSVGDQMLVQVASRLTGAVRESDIVARLGGDEFVVVVQGIDAPADAAHVADKIVKAVSEPYQIEGNELRTSPSIGICLYPDDAQEIGDLLKNADVAMYHAKARGRGNYQFFTAEMNLAATRRMALEADLRTALDRRQFILHYQPQIELASRRLIGFEALVRWQHPVKGMVPPADFIPMAEETGLILPLGEWVLREACRQLKEWQEGGMADVRISVNLSPLQFQDGALCDRVAAVLAETGLDAKWLDLEVTESMAMGSPEESIRMMGQLNEIGVSLAIDDFGTGYSSLAYLKLFPIQRLKIDRSFVKDIEKDENDAAICDTTIALARKLGLGVIAEGVETQAQLEFLERAGCEAVQGYLFSKPLPAERVREFVGEVLASSAALIA